MERGVAGNRSGGRCCHGCPPHQTHGGTRRRADWNRAAHARWLTNQRRVPQHKPFIWGSCERQGMEIMKWWPWSWYWYMLYIYNIQRYMQLYTYMSCTWLHMSYHVLKHLHNITNYQTMRVDTAHCDILSTFALFDLVFTYPHDVYFVCSVPCFMNHSLQENLSKAHRHLVWCLPHWKATGPNRRSLGAFIFAKPSPSRLVMETKER